MGETTRSYTGQLHGLDGEQAWRHHELHNHAVGALLDCFLSIRAGVGPEAAELGNHNERRFARLVLVTWWFTVERPHPLNERGQLKSSAEVPARLAEYVRDDVEGWIEDTKPAWNGTVRDGSVWVDRRSSWLTNSPAWGHWTGAVNDIFTMSGLRLNSLLSQTEDGLPVIPSWEMPATKQYPSTAREWVSNRFGDGKKVDFAVFSERWQLLENSTFTAGQSGAQFEREVRAALGGTDLEGGRIGRAAARVIDLYKQLCRQPEVTADDLDRFNKALRTELDETRVKDQRSGGRPWADWILQRLLAYTKTQRKDWKTDPLNAVVNAAQGRHASITSLNRSHLIDLVQLHDAAHVAIGDDKKAAYDELNRFVEERTLVSGSSERYRVGRRSIKGWKKVHERFRSLADPDDRKKEIRLLQSEGFHLGDNTLFEWLSEHPECWEQVVSFSEREEHVFRARTRKISSITLPDPIRNPDWAPFGKNYWPQRASSVPRTVVLSLWNGSDGFSDVTATLVAGRLQRDRQGRAGSPAAARNDRLGRLAATGTESAAVAVLSEPNSVGTLSLCFDRSELERAAGPLRPRRWFARIAFKMTPSGPLVRFLEQHDIKPAVLEKEGRPAGCRVLGVDLGLRTAGAYGVWETVDESMVKQAAHANKVTISAEVLTLPSHSRGALGDGKDHYRNLAGGLQSAQAKKVAAPWARLIAVGSLVPNQQLGPAAADASRSLQWWEVRLIQESLKRMEREADDLDGRLARDAIQRFAREVLRAVRANSALARRIDRLSDPETTALEFERWASESSQRPDGSESKLREIPLAGGFIEAPEALVRALNLRWTAQDQALRAAVRGLRFLVFGGRPGRTVAIRMGLPPRRNQPYFQGVPLRLTPERLRILDDTYRVLVAYWTRSQPGLKSHERNERHAFRVAELRRRLREDLTKQVASGIVRTALQHGCHVIAVEDLENLRTRAANTRATNRMLRRWAKTQIFDTVKELCELHGLMFRTVRAAYTSRLDSRSGVYGLRYRLEPAIDARSPNSRLGRRLAELRSNSERLLLQEPHNEWAKAVRSYLHQVDSLLDAVPPAGALMPVPDHVAPWFGASGHQITWVLPGDRPPGMLDADENAGANIALRWASFRRAIDNPAEPE